VALFERLVAEEYTRLLEARDRDVHDRSKTTTLPISRTTLVAYVTEDVKMPWYIDLLNINLDVADAAEARQRIVRFVEAFRRDGTRITKNLNSETQPRAAVEESA
jgi:malate synthase